MRRAPAATMPLGPAVGCREGAVEQGQDLAWRVCRFDELSPLELSRIYRARQQVFVVEQQCLFVDADELDESAWHLAGWSRDSDSPLAYARLVEPGAKYAEPAMGRVITVAAARGKGLGRELVRRAIEHAERVHPGQGLRISAQQRLQRFYSGFGFVPVGEGYLEDGIAHIEMLRRGA